MADEKSAYSEQAKKYVGNKLSQKEVIKSKNRESRYNENWKKISVNINEIVEAYAPNSKGEQKNGKFIYFGEKYNVVADLPSGYLRIMERASKQYVKLDGTPGSRKETHFKIKKREEM